VVLAGVAAVDHEVAGSESQHTNHRLENHGIVLVQKINSEVYQYQGRRECLQGEGNGDVECVPYNLVIGGVRFVAVVRGEEEGGEGGAEIRDDEASEQRGVKTRGGGSEGGGEVQREEERGQHQREAAGGGEWTEREVGDRGGDFRGGAVVFRGGGEEIERRYV